MISGDSVKYKKYFYALRPLLAGIYIQKNQCPPPVLFDNLLEMEMEMEMQPELHQGIMELLEVKKNSDEKETGRQIPVIRNFIAAEIARQKPYVESLADDRKAEWDVLNKLFLDILA